MSTLNVTEVLLSEDKASLWAMWYYLHIKEDEELYSMMTPLDARMCWAARMGFRTVKFQHRSNGEIMGYYVIGTGGSTIVDRTARDISVGNV